MDIEIAYIAIDGVKIKKQVGYGSLAWGTIYDEPTYWKGVQKGKLKHLGDTKQSIKNGQRGVLMYAVYENEDECIAMNIPYGITIDANAFAPNGFSYAGYLEFSDYAFEKEGVTKEVLDNFVELYVPFNETANGGRIPILWKAMYNNPDSVKPAYNAEFLSEDNAVSLEKVNELFGQFKQDFPSVDLDTEKHLRYAVFDVQVGDNSYSFVYNRNNTAYNGNKDYLRCIATIVIAWISDVKFDELTVFKFIDYVAGVCGKEGVFIQFGDVEESTENKASEIAATDDNAEFTSHNGTTMIDYAKHSGGYSRK